MQRGFPVKLAWGGSNEMTADGFGVGTLRPDYVAGCNKSTSGSSLSRVSEWFNTSCFTQPGGTNAATGGPNNEWVFGNEPRVDATIRQQGVVNFDFAVFKRTSITERFNVEFRTEFFNLFNHTNFGRPSATVGASDFGQIWSAREPRIVQFALRLSF